MNDQLKFEESKEENIESSEVKSKETDGFEMLYNGMQKKVKKLEIINCIVIALLGIILIVNVIGLFKSSMTKATGNSETSQEKVLPKTINKDIASKIINEIKEYYNNDETSNLYNVLGDYAKTLVSYEDFQKSLSKLKILGKMISVSYMNYSYLQSKDGTDWFLLNYVAKYDNGDGSATVTIIVTGESWEIAGFKLKIDELKETKN